MAIQKTFFTGIRWTGFSSLLSFVLGLLQIALLARYLEKSDFAWVAIAGVFVNIGIQLQQSGINSAIIQQPNLTKIQLSTTYWLNLAFGFVLFMVASALAFVLHWVYASPILLPIFIFYNTILLIQAFAVQYKALLQKKFHFQILSTAEIIGTLVGFIFAITTAVAGWGAYALVGGYVLRYLAEAIWIILMGRPQFVPSLEWDWQSVQPLVDFGGWHLAERLVTHFSAQIDILIIGKLLGSEALGTYDVFKRVLVRPLNLLNEIFEKVTFPILSQFQTDITLQKKLYLNLLTHLGAINFPLLAFLAIAAVPLIQLIFGASWVEGAPIFQLLCLFCLFHFLLNPVDTLLLANGNIKLWLYANLTFIPLQILLLNIGNQGGLIGIVFANVMAYAVFTFVIYYWIVFPQIQSNFMELIKRLALPILLTLLATLTLFPFRFFTSNVILLIAAGLLFTTIYLLLTFFYNRDFMALVWQFMNIKK